MSHYKRRSIASTFPTDLRPRAWVVQLALPVTTTAAQLENTALVRWLLTTKDQIVSLKNMTTISKDIDQTNYDVQVCLMIIHSLDFLPV